LPSFLAHIRSLAMEKLAISILSPCRYALAGCTETVHHTAKVKHDSAYENWTYQLSPSFHMLIQVTMLRRLMQMAWSTRSNYVSLLQCYKTLLHCKLMPLLLILQGPMNSYKSNILLLTLPCSIEEEVIFMATVIALPGAVDWVMMQLYFGHCAMLVLQKQERVSFDQLFFALVLLVEINEQADSSCTGTLSPPFYIFSLRLTTCIQHLMRKQIHT
uniref:Secreted protein n=1 Tax=Taenia asiatica TaxID=60517 RepID=A0A0R3VYQ4_TAEAS